ncbi:MAG: hypothetical protein EHM41_09555 [Chloroflexi bacterium]|nr:MAG: hypothetical protein EHM41_09555 [Chloroflexota bacterium]
MESIKVVEWVDIRAPKSDVFQLILDLKRRIQLSPFWGVIDLDCVSDEFPCEGSFFRTKIVQGGDKELESKVITFVEGTRLCYQTRADDTSQITWTVQDCAAGTRLIYEEEFRSEEESIDEVRKTVREAVKKWLNNIQRYSELHTTRSRRFIKWFLDRYFLKLRVEQRNVITALIFMKAVSIIAFIMAAMAYGMATLIN